MITSMCNSYEHTIVITNRHLVQGDFLKQLEKVTKLHPHALILREKDLTDDAYENTLHHISRTFLDINKMYMIIDIVLKYIKNKKLNNT